MNETRVLSSVWLPRCRISRLQKFLCTPRNNQYNGLLISDRALKNRLTEIMMKIPDYLKQTEARPIFNRGREFNNLRRIIRDCIKWRTIKTVEDYCAVIGRPLNNPRDAFPRLIAFGTARTRARNKFAKPIRSVERRAVDNAAIFASS